MTSNRVAGRKGVRRTIRRNADCRSDWPAPLPFNAYRELLIALVATASLLLDALPPDDLGRRRDGAGRHPGGEHFEPFPRPAAAVGGQCRALGKTGRRVDNDDDESADVFSASWVLATSPANGFDKLILDGSTAIQPGRRIRLWTDDYSNLFQILR